jgi:hypothetical protein
MFTNRCGHEVRLGEIISPDGYRQTPLPWLSFLKASRPFPATLPPTQEFHRPYKEVALCASRKPVWAQRPSCQRRSLMHDPQYLARICKAARVSATHVQIGHVVPAPGDPLADSLDAPLRVIQADIDLSQSFVQLPARVVSIAKFSVLRTCSAVRRRTSLPAGIPACCGSFGLMRLAIASGSSRFSRPSNSTCLIKLLFPEPFGPAKTVRTGTPQAAVLSNSRITR